MSVHHCDPLPWHRPRGLVIEELIRVHLAGARLLQRPGSRAGQHYHPCLRTGLFRLSDIAGFLKIGSSESVEDWPQSGKEHAAQGADTGVRALRLP